MIINSLQASEDVTVNHRVGGSIPSQGAISSTYRRDLKNCAIGADSRYSMRVVSTAWMHERPQYIDDFSEETKFGQKLRWLFQIGATADEKSRLKRHYNITLEYRPDPKPKIAVQPHFERIIKETRKELIARHALDRKGRIRQATPPWADLAAIKEIYKTALRKSSRTRWKKKFFSVDHIIPLKGKNVCGLHIPINMRVVSYSQNSSKHNKWSEVDGLHPTEHNGLLLMVPS